MNSLNGIRPGLPVTDSKVSDSASRGNAPNEFAALVSQSIAREPKVPAPPAALGASVGLTFSNHAIERMQQRGIHFSQDVLSRIEDAVAKASEKGSRETLVLTDDSALVVNTRNKKVVTVLDKENMREHLFTNIDSTVMI